jgi:hypothetical protein
MLRFNTSIEIREFMLICLLVLHPNCVASCCNFVTVWCTGKGCFLLNSLTLSSSDLNTMWGVKVEVTLRLALSQGGSISWYWVHCGSFDQILLHVGMLLSESCGLVSVGHHLWQEDGYAVCSAIIQLFESSRIRNHTLLSHLRLPQPVGLGSHIYIPK